MYCNACGKSISDDARYCAYCGIVVGNPSSARHLTRPRLGRKVAGVCLGVGHYLDLDPTLVRLLLVLITLMGGIFPGVIVYVLGWIVIPEEPFALPAGTAVATS